MKKHLAFLFAALLIFAVPLEAQTALGVHGGSDSLGAISSTAWRATGYTFGTVLTEGFIWVKNIGTADLGIAQDGDTTGTGTFGKYYRLEPGQETPWIPARCTEIWLKSLKAGTNGMARINIIR